MRPLVVRARCSFIPAFDFTSPMILTCREPFVVFRIFWPIIFSMLLPRYELKSDESLTVFEFVSVGKKGRIPKIVQYVETNLKDFYNLGFGDKDAQTGEVDDTVITDNGDSEKVLATVTATVYAFPDKYPEAWVYATGSTKARTRLYRIGLTNNLAEILADFELYGQKDGTWQEFARGVVYEAFLVKRRSKTNEEN